MIPLNQQYESAGLLGACIVFCFSKVCNTSRSLLIKCFSRKSPVLRHGSGSWSPHNWPADPFQVRDSADEPFLKVHSFKQQMRIQDPVAPWFDETPMLVWKMHKKASCWSYTHVRVQVAVMVAASFLSALFLSLAVSAKSVEQASFKTSPFTKVVTENANRHIVNLDRLRVNYILGYDVFDVISSSIENVNATVYLATVGVGCPPTDCKWF